MRKYQMGFLLLALLAVVSLSIASNGQEGKHDSASTGMHAAHIMVAPDQLKWGPAPPALPPGAQVAAIEGDPSKAGAFTIRVKFPDGYRVPPHWHPTDERVTVIQGTLGMGLGEKFDPAAGREMPAGSYALMPQGTRHFAWANGETIIQVSGTGPFTVTYVNPADDPRKVAKE
jgi:quercetin dioxygenase-like cupin family protein